MAKSTQAKWEYTDAGILTVELPTLSTTFDLTKLYYGWGQMDEAERFFSAYGVKQKLSDRCAASKDATYTDTEKITRMEELFNYAVKERKLPPTKRGTGLKRMTIIKAKSADAKSGIEAIMAKFNVAEDVAKAIQAELDKLVI